MTDIQRKFSPDGRYFILVGSYEMRMSHWVSSAALWEVNSQQVLLALGNSLWSTERIEWSADSTYVSVSMRRYPGDAPGLELEIFPDRRVVQTHPPADIAAVPFAEFENFLESFYARNQRRKG